MSGLLAFHAHPDDETIAMGGTLAALADHGVATTVVTATRGEAGEIHNQVDPEPLRERLGALREAEERAALKVLGVDDLAYLGYRDSGMMGTAENRHPDAFWGADFLEATGRLVRVIRDRRPRVVTAYDPFGGYGHPDHIQVHRVGTAAFFGAPDVGRFPVAEFGDPWQPDHLLWTTWSRERMVGIRRTMRGESALEDDEPEPPSGFLSVFLGVRRDVTPWLARKHAALLCHDSQFAAESWIRVLPAEGLRAFLGEEVFVPVWGDPGVDDPIGALLG